MKISTKGRYAVRLMYDLAMHHTGDWIALKDISRRQEISVKYLEQIVRQLSIRGYLKSLRGPKGGYQLSRDPKDYTICSKYFTDISCLLDMSFNAIQSPV